MTTKTISPIDLYAKQMAGEETVIIDVRSLPEYEDLHIKGAILQPITEFNPDSTMEYLRSLGHKVENIYVTCATGKRASKACEILQNANYDNVYVINGGTVAWDEAGLPVEHGS